MFDATFNLITRVILTVFFGTLKNGSLKINSLALKGHWTSITSIFLFLILN